MLLHSNILGVMLPFLAWCFTPPVSVLTSFVQKLQARVEEKNTRAKSFRSRVAAARRLSERERRGEPARGPLSARTLRRSAAQPPQRRPRRPPRTSASLCRHTVMGWGVFFSKGGLQQEDEPILLIKHDGSALLLSC